MSELPINWISVPLELLGSWGSGGTPPKGNRAYYDGDIPWAVIGDLSDGPLTSTSNRISALGLANSSAKIIPPETVLIAMYGSIGKLAITKIECSTNQAIAFCIADEELVEKRYLFHALKWARPELIKLGQGASQQNISQTILKAFEVPLAPFAEQLRIAQKLDELLAQVDTLKARIDAIPALLKRFRQSVLAAAVSGRLTEEWRAENSSCASHTQLSSLQADNSTLPSGSSLPMDWSLKNAGDICGFITKGTTPSKEKMTAGQGEVPYIKVYNLTFSGALDFSVDPTFVNTDTHSIDLKRSIVKPGDVLMNIVGPPLGKVSIVPATYPEWNINQAIARFRAGDGISSGYLALCLRTEEVLNHAISRAKATAGQFNLTLEICRELPLPVPPEVEQTEIVRRVEQLFAFADQLEAKVATAKARIDRLTQSILAKAFRGELVPQDPNDEPASVLLQRIQAQRTATPKAKRGRKSA